MAEVKGMTLIEFQSRFHNEQACREYLFQQLWSKAFSCPRCHLLNTTSLKAVLCMNAVHVVTKRLSRRGLHA